MASRIPTYERQHSMPGNMPVARATTAVSPNSPVAAAMGNLAQSVGQAGNVIAQIESVNAAKEREKQENAAAVTVSNTLSEADVYWQQDTTERFKNYTVDQGDMRPAIAQDFDKWAAEQTEKLPTEKSKQYFLVHASKMKAKLQTGAYEFQEKAVTNKLNAESAAGEQADENIVFNDATRYDEVLRRRIEPLIARTDLDEASKIKMADQFKRRLSLAVERGEMERDPAGWYRRRFGTFDPGVGGAGPAGGGTPSGAGFEGVMERIFASEGGYAASDGNTGQPVNFGINQGANPDIDVKSLTKEGAAKLYRERYWNKIGGDNLPPALQGTAMDAAVNQGPARAKEWIRESGGDPVKFNALRRAHYESLLEDPANRKFRKAWLGRLEAYERDAALGASAGVAVAKPVSLDGGPAPEPVTPPTPPKTFTGMDWEQQLALKRHAETVLKQSEATFRAEADRALRDATAMHADGVLDPMNLQRPHFDRAYGAEGERVYAEYLKSRDMAVDIGKFKTQSPAEIMAELELSKPQPGPGYAADDARYGQRMKAATQVIEQRNRDPVSYATANSQPLSAARKAIDSMQPNDPMRPAAIQKYAGDLLSEQRRLGVTEPRILSPQQADAIAGMAMNAVKPDDSARLVASLEQDYGPLFPQVFGQLVKENKIAGELLIIPNLPTQAAREMVSRMARIKEADLTAGIEAADQKVVKDEVTAKLEGFVRAIPGMTPQAVSTTNSYETTIRKLAYQFALSGEKPSDAVERAYGLVLGHYEFDGTARYPAGADIAGIKKGSDLFLKNELAGIDVPFDLTGSRNPAEAAGEWQRTVQSSAQWYTRSDDAGLELWAGGANGVRYRVTKGGKQVSFDWAELRAKPEVAKAAIRTSQDALKFGDMRIYERLRKEEEFRAQQEMDRKMTEQWKAQRERGN